MAELILSSVGNAIGATAPQAVRGFAQATLSTAGALAGRALDQRLFGGDRRIEGPRRAELHINGASEGQGLADLYGRMRLSGVVIWAARPKERAIAETQSAGGKGGGPSATATRYSYTLSFAVALCEGEATRIERVWANGEALDLAGVAHRFYPGTEDQDADPLIEAIEGAPNAPAYRGVAYVVFEDFPLDPYGGAIPQLSFELVRRPPRRPGERRLEDMARGVCLIPGAGEFALGVTPVFREAGFGREASENQHAASDRTDLAVSLDHLAQDLPGVRNVTLVVGWFGDDLRAGVCRIRPGVEIAEKGTRPYAWRVAGLERGAARLLSRTPEGGPAFGGTPADACVLEAIAELKRRGLAVTLYPFLFLDVPPGNGLPDPHGGAEQAAYPWRGRIVAGADVAGDVAAFFNGADGYRRFVLHYAALAAQAGGVDAFVIGSELRGLTTARAADGAFPAVAALRQLAADVRAASPPGAKLTYAADWSEYFGHQPPGTGDVYFHLDPLWADPNIDAVGIDWYPPHSDWRDGPAHLDAAIADNPYDPAYHDGRLAGGEAFDWFYPSPEARQAQARAPIADGAHGKPWVFRPKDLVSWWSEPHVERRGGQEVGAPTAWVPRSKPIWLVELGCPAVDKGGNAPNLFVDARSSESALPPFSSGRRDDAAQRALLEAHLRRIEAVGAALNPISPIYGGPMLPPERVGLWAWDARPFPAFPARADVWSDAPAWSLGHWLNGRAGATLIADVVRAIVVKSGLAEPDVAGLAGSVAGLVLEAPTTARRALEPALRAMGAACIEREGRLRFFQRGALHAGAITRAACVEGAIALGRDDPAAAPREARLTYLDPTRDYRRAVAVARRRDGAADGVLDLDIGLALIPEEAQACAARLLAEGRATARRAELALPLQALAFEPGDRVELAMPGAGGPYVIAAIEDRAHRTLTLSPVPPEVIAFNAAPPAAAAPRLALRPAIAILDLPPLPGFEDDARPLAAAFADPWPGPIAVHAAGRARGTVLEPACFGELQWALYAGPVGRSDDGNRVRVRLSGRAPASVDRAALDAGANLFAVEGPNGWECLQAQWVAQVGPELYELSGFRRGLLGAGPIMANPAPVGAPIVLIDRRLARLDLGPEEANVALGFSANGAERTATWRRIGLRPFAPAHLRAAREADGAIRLTWIRQTRVGGDSWTAVEVPLGEDREAYVVEVLKNGAPVRRIEAAAPSARYPLSEQTADFGGAPTAIAVRVAQVSTLYGVGLFAESTLSV